MWRSHALFLACLFVVHIFAFRQTYLNFNTHIAGDEFGDGSLTAWQILWPSTKIKHDLKCAFGTKADFHKGYCKDFPSLDDSNIFAGIPNAYSFSDRILGWTPVVLILDSLKLSDTAIINTIQVLSHLLYLLGLYFLAFYLSKSNWIALFATTFGFFLSYRIDMMLHLQMQFDFVIPFGLLFLSQTFLAVSFGRLWQGCTGLGICGIFSLAVSPHIFIFLFVACLFLLSALIVIDFKHSQRDRAYQHLFRRLSLLASSLRENRVDSVLSIALSISLLLAFLVIGIYLAQPYMDSTHKYGLSRLPVEAYSLSTRLNDWDYFSVSVHEKNVSVHPIVTFLFILGVFRTVRGPLSNMKSLKKETATKDSLMNDSLMKEETEKAKRRNGEANEDDVTKGETYKSTLLTKPLNRFGFVYAGRSSLIDLIFSALFTVLFLLSVGEGIPAVLQNAGLLFIPIWIYSSFLVLRRQNPNAKSKGFQDHRLTLLALALLTLPLFTLPFGPIIKWNSLEIPVSLYSIFYDTIPGFNRIRAASRIVVIFWPVMGIFAGIGLVYLLRSSVLQLRILTLRIGEIFTFFKINQYSRIKVFAYSLVWIGVCILIVPTDYSPRGNIRAAQVRFQKESPFRIKIAPTKQDRTPLIFAIHMQIKSFESFLQLTKRDAVFLGGYTGIAVIPYEQTKELFLEFLSGEAISPTEVFEILENSSVNELWVYGVSDLGKDRLQALQALAEDRVRRNASALHTKCQDNSLHAGNFEFAKRASKRHALGIAYFSKGDFCTRPYGAFQDRSLVAIWDDGQDKYRSPFRLSTPPFDHPLAPTQYVFIGIPVRRGMSRLQIEENGQVITHTVVRID